MNYYQLVRVNEEKMKNVKALIFLGLFLMSFLSGCVVVDSQFDGFDSFGPNTIKIHGSGNVITIYKDFRNFKDLTFNSGFKVKLIKSNDYSVMIQADDNIEKHLNIYQSGSKLTIGLESGYSLSNVTLVAVISMPTFETITSNGGTIIDLTGFEYLQNINFNLNGGCAINGNFYVDKMDLNLTGGSIVNLTGSGTKVNVYGSGGAILNLYDFRIADCNINFGGGSIANIYVTDFLNLNLSGGSIVKYKGNPKFGNIQLSGGSIFIKEN